MRGNNSDKSRVAPRWATSYTSWTHTREILGGAPPVQENTSAQLDPRTERRSVRREGRRGLEPEGGGGDPSPGVPVLALTRRGLDGAESRPRDSRTNRGRPDRPELAHEGRRR